MKIEERAREDARLRAALAEQGRRREIAAARREELQRGLAAAGGPYG